VTFRILQIDDDLAMRDIVAATLRRQHLFTAITCGSGEEGLAIATTTMPDLILCDVVMPGMDGPAVLQQLRQNESTADIPVIFTTARTQPSDIVELLMLGAADVIAKPFKLKTLAQTIRDHLHINDTAPDDGCALSEAPYDFAERLRSDLATLEGLRRTLISDSSAVPDGLKTCVHNLAGAAGVYEFQSVSLAASAVEDTIIEQHVSQCAPQQVEDALEKLLACIKREL
jgi:two-component system OmpR family response regulator